LERAIYNIRFHNEALESLLKPLSHYQNEDGGFGNGIEPDFWMKESSPMATSIGLKYLKLVEKTHEGQQMIQKAIAYLETVYSEKRKGWFCVDKRVNDYPHAPWWTYNIEKEMTVIDESWGNPTSELIGYLIRYKDYVKQLNVEELVEYAIYHYLHESELESEHEVYCYIRLYNNLNEEKQKELVYRIEHAVEKLIAPELNAWTTYVAMPLNFIEVDSECFFGIKVSDINRNLDYFVERLNETGSIDPVWSWDDYKEQWIDAKRQWKGIILLETVTKLERFQRI